MKRGEIANGGVRAKVVVPSQIVVPSVKDLLRILIVIEIDFFGFKAGKKRFNKGLLVGGLWVTEFDGEVKVASGVEKRV